MDAVKPSPEKPIKHANIEFAPDFYDRLKTAADRRLSDAIAVVSPRVSDVLFACMFLLITLHLLRSAAVSASSLHFSPAVMFRWLSSTMYVVFLNLHQLLAQYFINSGLRQLS